MNAGSIGWGRRQRGGWADWVVAGLAVGAVVLLLVPVPTWLLDLLLAANLAMSLVLLLVALQVDSPLKVGAFPTWIVLSTLVRLALNVSSTRLILLQGNAGRVVGAYGELVAGANPIVGGVLFALLTIVQFIVIARGAERVAEVGARFVLDGLPGKQMAIDAELRAGTLDARQAELRRRELARESQFYGAMDGAMKFVKGDVIAAVLVIFVNLLGGFGIGMTQQRLDALSALRRYGLLTIGDGLAAQVPALLVATAAGVLVTRVAGEGSTRGVGSEFAGQLLRHPKVLRGVAGACLLVALAPRMPAAPFIAVAFACALASLWAPAERARSSERSVRWVVAPDLARWVPGALRLRKTPLERFAESVGQAALAALSLPSSVVEGVGYGVDGALPSGTVELHVRGVCVHRARVLEQPLAEQQRDFVRALRRGAHHLVGLEEVHRWLGELAQEAPATVREAIPTRVSLATFTEALRQLLREGVPLLHLREIVEALVQPESVGAPSWPSDRPPHAQEITAIARRASRVALTRAVHKGPGPLRVVRFDGLIEDTLREGSQLTAQGRRLALAPSAARDILAALRRVLERQAVDAPGSAEQPNDGAGTFGLALLVPLALRPLARQLVETNFPDLPVVSAEELLPELSLELAATVTLFGDVAAPAIAQAG